MSEFNLLQNLHNKKKESSVTFVKDPFPILVIKDPLSKGTYQILSDHYPKPKTCFQEDLKNHQIMLSNTYYSLNADSLLDHSKVNTVWKKFVEYQTSNQFFQDLLKFLGKEIQELHPGLENEIGKPLQKWSSGVRWKTSRTDLALDCQVGFNSPVIQKSQILGPHLDDKSQLYTGLFYMRKDDDDSKGGILEFYSHPDGKFILEDHPLWGKNTIRDARLKRILSIPYQENCLILFINSKKSLHAISEIESTLHMRRIVTLSGRILNHPRKGLWD